MNHPIDTLIDTYPDLQACRSELEQADHILQKAYQQDGKLLLCGNGGSASDCDHIVGELMKGFESKRPLPAAVRERFLKAFPDEGEHLADHLQGALPAISLMSHGALISAFTNDVAAETAYAQQVYGYGRPGDVLLAISTSGNSVNVLRAVQVARVMGLATVGLTGQNGGRLLELCDVTIRAPRNATAAVQELHLPIYHALCISLETAFF